MYNQIRAEFYKLFHTKALYLTFALILAVFGIFSIGGQQQFVASSSSVDETWKIPCIRNCKFKLGKKKNS